MKARKDTIKIDPELLVSPRVSSGEIDLARYNIRPCGLASDTVGDVVIDRRIALIQPHPESMLYLCPLCPNPQPTSAEAWFYCDCIAYEHEIPAIVYPTEEVLIDFQFRYVHNGPSQPRECQIVHLGEEDETDTFTRHPIPPQELTQAFLMNQLLTILEETREMRHGPLTFVLFRTHRYRRRVHLDYSCWYRSVAKEVSLYSAALRQADFLAEYLGYYRVVESATGSNGKKWIAHALERLRSHRFGKVLIGHGEDDHYCPRNILGIYKRRASIRLRQLRKDHPSDQDLAWYFYNVNRCGIAHGRNEVIRGDITPSYFDIARDAVVLKLLARMAIEEKKVR